MIAGYQNLAGRTIGTLKVISRARLQPLAWSCKCSRCGTEQIVSHTRLQAGASCANGACGRNVKPDGCAATIGTIPDGIRARDAEAAREFMRSESRREQTNPLSGRRPTDEDIASFDPNALTRPGRIPF